MKSAQLGRGLAQATLAFALALSLAPDAWTGSRYKVLHSFTGGRDGGALLYGLVLDGSGNLYGASPFGGPHCDGGKGNCGIVFELTHQADDTWKESVLFNFSSSHTEGLPDSPLVLDRKGNLYGSAVGAPREPVFCLS